MNSDKDKYLLSQLILELLDGYIGDERLKLLDRWLMESDEALLFYCELMKNSALLRRRIDTYLYDPGRFWDDHLWQAMAHHEDTAPSLAVERPVERHEPVAMLKKEKSVHKINKISLVTALISGAALIFLVVYGSYVPPRERAVATLSDSLDAQWAEPMWGPAIGDRLYPQDGRLTLLSGVVKTVFDYGAEVIIEGPAEFKLVSAENMILYSGRVFAKIPQTAQGFSVQTPSSTIVDLGTEFGIQIDANQETHVHMYEGRVLLAANGRHSALRREEVVAGQSRGVTATGWIRDIPRQEHIFVRRINSQNGFLWRGENIDLADVLGGGSGFGDGLRNYSINPDTGEWKEGFHRREGLSTTAQCSYVTVDDLSLIDGVFVPDGRRSPVVVSSRGDVFEGCPATDGRYYWNISNGFYVHDAHHRQTLEGTRYGTRERPAISMHANSGITFDLDRMREELPAFELTAFRSLCGRTPINPVLEVDEPADFYVLVDGQVRFHFENVTTQDDPRLVDVPLSSDDRFLTLVIISRTDISSRRAIFALPEIVIAQIQ